jgi:hypothetical protein
MTVVKYQIMNGTLHIGKIICLGISLQIVVEMI